MIEHVVLFKPKPGLAADQLEGIGSALLSLRGCVAGILQFQVTGNLSDRSRGYSLVLFSRFVSKEALAAYAVHPDHVRIVETVVKPAVEDVIVADGQV
jgi:hypothetical protein